MRSMFRLLIVGASLAGAFARPATAQDLPLGTWSGTVRNLTAPARNQNARPASLAVKKVPDPHVRWRGGSGELLVVTLTLQQQSFDVGAVDLSEAQLMFSFVHHELDAPVRCTLLRQKDGSYEGDCTGALARRLMLTPPAAAPQK